MYFYTSNICIKYESENETKYNPDTFSSDKLDAAIKVKNCSEIILANSVKFELVEFHKIAAANQLYANDTRTRTIILEKVPKTEAEIVGDNVADPNFCFVEEDYTHSNDAFSNGDSNSDPDLERDPFADVDCDPSFELISPADVNGISNPSSSTTPTENTSRHNRQRKTLDTKLQCQLCRETHSSKKELQNHMKICSEFHKDSQSFCVICNKLYFRPQKYREHAKRMHGVKVEAPGKAKPFKCQVCTRSFAYKESLLSHSELHEQSITVIETSKLKPFECLEPDCSSSFECLSDLNRHKILHQTEVEFKCSMPNCDKEFKLAYYLYIHMQRIHSIQERPFKCLEPNCEKTFPTNGQLQKHKVCHSNARPFKCTDLNCDKTFPSNDRLLIHMARSHNKSGRQLKQAEIKPFKCGECERAFCKTGY